MESFQLARELYASGSSSYDLKRSTKLGTLERLRWGVYVEPADRDLEVKHRLLIASSLAVGQGESVVSFVSAGVVHRLPVWYSALSKVHLTRSRPDSGRIRKLVHVHVAVLSEEDKAVVDEIPVTTLPRTFVDLARTQPLAQGVAAGDHALRLGMAPDAVVDQLERARARRGIRRARVAAELIDEASESAGESLSRVTFFEGGFPAPLLQVRIKDGGQAIGRVDFMWPEFGTVGEFDGETKYGRLLKPGESVADAVLREKKREDAIRDLGYQVVRWTWTDLFEPERLFLRLRRAFARGHAIEPSS